VNVNSGVITPASRLNEENWVGLQGGFGTLQLGRSDTAMKKTGGNYFRAFTDTLAEPSLNVDRTARADGIHYTTPNIAGFQRLPDGGAERFRNRHVLGRRCRVQVRASSSWLPRMRDTPDTYTYAAGQYRVQTRATGRSVASGASVRVTSACFTSR
jgi:predicted porin